MKVKVSFLYKTYFKCRIKFCFLFFLYCMYKIRMLLEGSLCHFSKCASLEFVLGTNIYIVTTSSSSDAKPEHVGQWDVRLLKITILSLILPYSLSVQHGYTYSTITKPIMWAQKWYKDSFKITTSDINVHILFLIQMFFFYINGLIFMTFGLFTSMYFKLKKMFPNSKWKCP